MSRGLKGMGFLINEMSKLVSTLCLYRQNAMCKRENRNRHRSRILVGKQSQISDVLPLGMINRHHTLPTCCFRLSDLSMHTSNIRWALPQQWRLLQKKAAPFQSHGVKIKRLWGREETWDRMSGSRGLHDDASMTPRSQMTRQFCAHVAAKSKNVSSICIIVRIRFSWNRYTAIKIPTSSIIWRSKWEKDGQNDERNWQQSIVDWFVDCLWRTVKGVKRNSRSQCFA